MDDNIIPSVIFVSCANEETDSLIKHIFGDLPFKINDQGISMYEWHINTKYYESEVRLCSIKNKLILSPEFISSIEGVFIYFDAHASNSLDKVNDWLLYLKEFEAEVNILACKTCNESSETYLSKINIQEWCVREGFELIELQPLIDEEWELEQDFIETCGVKRVIQALEAHVWPNLVLKERKYPTNMSELWHGGHCISALVDYDECGGATAIEQNSPKPEEKDSSGTPEQLENRVTEELFSNEHTDFSDLFSQLPAMRERANAMPSEQRKKYAEEVVLAYWKAIGGDEHEILDC